MQERQTAGLVDYPNTIVKVPEAMVMQRADGSSRGVIPSTGNSARPGHIVKTKRPAHKSSSTEEYRRERMDPPLRDNNNRPNENDQLPTQRMGSDENSRGLLSAPLAWVQRNRDLRRRLQLQQEAEEQLRKIAEAEHYNRNGESRGAMSVIFAGRGSRSGNVNQWNAGNDQQSDDEFKIGTQHLSKSGEGMTAELDLEDDEDEYLIPKVRIHPEPRLIKAHSGDSIDSPRKSDFKSPAYILTPQQMHQIAIHVLPRTIAYCPWRRVYSLSRDGDSFDGCLRIISDVPRSLMVIRTTRGAVFGGYADSPWRPVELGNAKFYGSAQACLFSVKDPEKPNNGLKSPTNILNVYRWSGKNRYIQLCDSSSKMLAFGGGGSDGAFGLCVQEDFQSGSTGPCDTFDNAPLCDQETFDIVDVEFWEFLTGVF